MNTNFDVLNYLYLTNSRLGQLYETASYNPLPANFVFDEEKIKERLALNEMEKWTVVPDFFYGDKKIIKKYLKNSLKNIKKLEKNINKCNFSQQFLEKFKIYLDVRFTVTTLLWRECNEQKFDEISAYQEISKLNPVLSPMLNDLFFDDFDAQKIEDIEKQYEMSYVEKLKVLESQNQKRKKKNVQKTATATRQFETLNKISKTKTIVKPSNKKLAETEKKFTAQSAKVKEKE